MSRLRCLDGIAAQILANLAPLSFDRARSAADVDAVLRLRYRCIVEMGWARPEDLPDGRESDEYDHGATFIVCRDDDAVIGALRLVPPIPGRSLPTERHFGIQVDPPGATLEGGRLVVSRDHRAGRSHLVIAGLIARGWIAARELGYERAITSATLGAIQLYRGLGLRITELGPPRRHWGEERAIELAGAEDTFAFTSTHRVAS